jgi:hypothetical protein
MLPTSSDIPVSSPAKLFTTKPPTLQPGTNAPSLVTVYQPSSRPSSSNVFVIVIINLVNIILKTICINIFHKLNLYYLFF